MGEVNDGDHHRAAAQAPPSDNGGRPSSGARDDDCPYQGLAPFETDRTDVFFGRTQATRNLLDRLGPRLGERGTILLVSGASGVGKSSLLRAGLMPALAKGTPPIAGSQHWPRLLITPTTKPLRALAEGWVRAFGGQVETVHERLRGDPWQALSGSGSPAGRLVLVVDQFEELFTLVTEERERQAFVRALHAMAEGPPHAGVIIGVRADYWDRCAAYPQFAEAIQDGQVIVGPMTESDLRLAITGPAAAVGLEIEPGLVELILSELRAGQAAEDRYEAGALPLLSQALLNTWERRENGRLTVRGYEESGRVRDSVRRTADEVLERLPPEDRKTALRLFRRMTVITVGGRVARRGATLTELHAAASAHSTEQRRRVEALLSAFADQRLLTLHEDGVEIAHDALLATWPTLRQWLEPDLTAQAVYDRLVEDAAQWAENHRDPAFLYRGARLLSVQDARPRWDRDPDSFPPPGSTVAGFVAASTRAARRASRRRGLVMAGLAVLSVLALLAAGAAVDAANDADHQRGLAVSRQLAAESEVADDPATSALLAVTGWRIAPTPEARHRMLDVAARSGRAVLPGYGRPVTETELVFSPDGSIIATGSSDGVVQLWDTASRRRLGAPIVHPDRGCSAGFDVAFSPGGKVLAMACFTSVRFWDVSTRRLLGAPLDTKSSDEPMGSVQAMAFSPDGRTLATSTYEGTTRLWDVAGRRKVGGTLGTPDTKTGDKAVRAVAFSPDGKRLVTAGADDLARLWDTAAHRQIGDAFTGHINDIEDISVSPDGTTLATTSKDGTARLWNLATHEQIGGALREPDGDRGFLGVAFSPDGKRLATAGAGGYTRLWDSRSRRPVGPALNDQRLPVRRVAFSPDGRILAAIGEDGAVWLWDPVAHRQVGAAMSALSGVFFSPDGRTLAAPGPGAGAPGTTEADRAVRLWDTATQRQVGRRLQPADAPASSGSTVYEIKFSSDGRTLTTASVGGDIRLWETTTQRQIGPPIYSDTDNNWKVEFSPDGRLLAVRRQGDSIGFWSVAGRREVGPRITFPDHSDSVREMAFSPDGTTLAVAGHDRAVRFFDVAARREIGRPLPAAVDGSFTDDLAFSPDGRTLATTAADGTVRLWDVAGRRQSGAALTGHTDFVTAIAFSPDGTALVTGSADDTVRLWDLPTRRQIGLPLTGHTGSVTGVAYSPDGSTVATVGNDETARLWNVAVPADPAAATCANVGRSFTRAEWERYVPGEKFQQVCP
ncbi:WD40 repeat domain-containing protein [Actinomadura sp. HBU206391]|uniref:WD40 repeat domain-containing protein n=1 Tax=Actinomadura sp. HBU206391 TaxID=2731692 RepID=UPI001650C6D2|nr:WD40 repeat domain-containing protein [Actinomadura sp. HBU206391]MBC6460662.1 WD40 repeat domain-containing protein [Actinomadura sp. HBU206391]